MKDKYKELYTEEYIEKLFDNKKILDKTSSLFDRKIHNMIDSFNSLQNNKKTSFFKYSLYPLAAAFIIILFLTFIFMINKYYINNNIFDSRISSIKGNSTVIKNNKATLLSLNNTIHENDIIETDKDSECTIKIENKSLIEITQKSRLIINNIAKDKDISIKLDFGKTIIEFNKQANDSAFKITTDDAIITVIGTKFSVEYSKEKGTDIFVYKGIVKVKIIKIGIETTLKENQSLNTDEFILNNIKKNDINEIKIKNDDKVKMIKNDDKQKKVVINKIYKYKNKDDSSKNSIIELETAENFFLIQTNTTILCFNYNGDLIWEKTFGKEKGIFFMSKPLIYKDKIYLSSLNKKLLIFDSKTGNLINTIITPGSISFDYAISRYDDTLFLPYPDGIYLFNTNDSSLIEKPVIQIKSPSQSVIDENTIYISSLIDNTLYAFNINGKKIWSYLLNNRNLIPSTIIDNDIYIGDNSGNFYKIDKNGNLQKNTNLSSGIASLITKYDKYLFVILKNGTLYKLNQSNLEIENFIKLPNILDKFNENYIFTIQINNNIIVTGNNNGEIIFIDPVKLNIIDNFKLSDYPITAIETHLNNTFFIGTSNGEIFKLNKDL